MDGLHEERVRTLVADACLAVERARREGAGASAELEWLRAELRAVAGGCDAVTAAEALLAAELVADALSAEPLREALAS